MTTKQIKYISNDWMSKNGSKLIISFISWFNAYEWKQSRISIFHRIYRPFVVFLQPASIVHALFTNKATCFVQTSSTDKDQFNFCGCSVYNLVCSFKTFIWNNLLKQAVLWHVMRDLFNMTWSTGCYWTC